jgi:hypothetical protein
MKHFVGKLGEKNLVAMHCRRPLMLAELIIVMSSRQAETLHDEFWS